MLELIQAMGLQHGPTAAVAALAYYLGNRHIKADHERFIRIEDGFQEGLDKVAKRLEAVSDKMDSNHAAVLQLLIDDANRKR